LKNGDISSIESVAHALGVRRGFEHVIGGTENAILDHAEHTHRSLVMSRHFSPPIRKAGPRSVFPDRVFGNEQRIGVRDGAATHGTAVENQDVPKEADIEETAQSNARPPDPAPDFPVRFGEFLGSPAAAHLHHGYAIAFLSEAVRRDAAAEAGSNDDVIVVGFRHAAPPCRGQFCGQQRSEMPVVANH
jgi:hypothetical protein